MKQQLINIINRFSNFMHLPSLIQLSGQRLFLPFYHGIKGEENLAHIQHLYPVRDEATFLKDLDYLLEHFKPIDLATLKSIALDGKKVDENCMHLSFDDGLREVHELILPILEKKGIPATLFINSAFVDNKDLFYRFKVSLLIEQIQQKEISFQQEKAIQKVLESSFPDNTFSIAQCADIFLDLQYEDIPKIDALAAILDLDFQAYLKKQQPYMTSSQIKDAIHRGFTVGGHSITHPLYSRLTLDEQLEQTEKSIQYIQETFGVAEKVFSFPFTDDGVERTFFEIVEADQIADLTFGCAGLKKENFPFHLQRFPMESTIHDANKLVNTEYFYYLSKAPFGKNKLSR